MATEKIIKLLSAFGIGSIVSALFAFMQSSKRNQLDYITKERSEWRKEMKSIMIDLLNGEDRRSAISRLKTQINPYGYDRNNKCNNDYYMNDGHIWTLLNHFDYSDEQSQKLSQYLQLLLKHDWERSKSEVGINNVYIWNILRLGLIILNLVIFFWAGNVDNTINLYLALVSIICLMMQPFVINWLSKLNSDLPTQKNILLITYIVIFAFPYTYSLFLIITLSNFYELIKFDTFASILPIIFIFIIISSEVFFLYRIFDFNQKYISQIKQLSRSKTDLEVNYYKVYNNNYRLKEKIASSKNKISQKDIDKLQSEQNKLQKQFEKETNNVKRIITEIQSSRG